MQIIGFLQGVRQLEDLITYCRRLDMEPLVEVNNEREVEIAIQCGAKVNSCACVYKNLNLKVHL